MVRRRSTQALIFGLLLVVASQAGGPTWAQTSRFEEVTEVVVVEVPVQVLRDGEPVRGLTAENFEIVDGRKKPTGEFLPLSNEGPILFFPTMSAAEAGEIAQEAEHVRV